MTQHIQLEIDICELHMVHRSINPLNCTCNDEQLAILIAMPGVVPHSNESGDTLLWQSGELSAIQSISRLTQAGSSAPAPPAHISVSPERTSGPVMSAPGFFLDNPSLRPPGMQPIVPKLMSIIPQLEAEPEHWSTAPAAWMIMPIGDDSDFEICSRILAHPLRHRANLRDSTGGVTMTRLIPIWRP